MLRIVPRTSVVALRRAVAGRAAFHVSSTLRNIAEEDRPWYVVGIGMAEHLEALSKNMSAAEKKALAAGFTGRFLGEPDAAVMAEASKYQQLAEQMLKERAMAAASKVLDAAAQEPGAVKTPTGLVIQTVHEGTGEPCPPGAEVTVHYTGSLAADGTVFDSSVKRGQPATFPVDHLIPGWQEGLKMMKVGGKAKMTIPSELGYGAAGAGPIPGDAILVFDVELISVKPKA
uniref:peptidylprolyl isomerase n=1 Tax=Hemiselmis tepida TaxID=464990 RepID=A0A7S0YVV8_9CRYP|mmetsp:Transcript_24591/g.62237  ORF Transcript_24591/g.62237 Transcript_24591/m.62237 type:complete len:230 (+) Transcript_24591:24-713(+)